MSPPRSAPRRPTPDWVQGGVCLLASLALHGTLWWWAGFDAAVRSPLVRVTIEEPPPLPPISVEVVEIAELVPKATAKPEVMPKAAAKPEVVAKKPDPVAKTAAKRAPSAKPPAPAEPPKAAATKITPEKKPDPVKKPEPVTNTAVKTDPVTKSQPGPKPEPVAEATPRPVAKQAPALVSATAVKDDSATAAKAGQPAALPTPKGSTQPVPDRPAPDARAAPPAAPKPLAAEPAPAVAANTPAPHAALPAAKSAPPPVRPPPAPKPPPEPAPKPPPAPAPAPKPPPEPAPKPPPEPAPKPSPAPAPKPPPEPAPKPPPEPAPKPTSPAPVAAAPRAGGAPRAGHDRAAPPEALQFVRTEGKGDGLVDPDARWIGEHDLLAPVERRATNQPVTANGVGAGHTEADARAGGRLPPTAPSAPAAPPSETPPSEAPPPRPVVPPQARVTFPSRSPSASRVVPAAPAATRTPTPGLPTARPHVDLPESPPPGSGIAHDGFTVRIEPEATGPRTSRTLRPPEPNTAASGPHPPSPAGVESATGDPPDPVAHLPIRPIHPPDDFWRPIDPVTEGAVVSRAGDADVPDPAGRSDLSVLPESFEISAVSAVSVRSHPLGRWAAAADDAIRSRWTWPEELRALGVGGTVVVRYRVTATGQVRELGIAVSSGQAALDVAALSAIPTSFPPPPAGYANVPLRYTFRYRPKAAAPSPVPPGPGYTAPNG